MPSLTRRASDRDLVAAYRAGDTGAFSSIYERHSTHLVRFAGRLLRDEGLAEDVVQEAMLRASRALLRDGRPIDLKPWLFRIVRNCALDELARHRFVTSGLEGGLVDNLPAPRDAEPAAAHDRRARLRDVLDDIADLPASQRHALVSREVEGVAHAKLAAELGITEQASKNLVYRARTNLVRAREARSEQCGDVRLELLAAADESGRARAVVLRHLARCSACAAFRKDIKTTGRALALLDPGWLLIGAGLGLGGLKLGGGLTLGGGVGVGKLATIAGVGAVTVGAVGLGTQVIGPGEPSPQTIRSRAVPAGLVAAGKPLPPGTTVVRQLIELSPGRKPQAAVDVTCPPGLRVADLLRPRGTQATIAYAPRISVGATRQARVLVATAASRSAARLTVGVLCKRPDIVGSLLAADARAFTTATHRVAVATELLRRDPGGTPRGSVRLNQPVVAGAAHNRWRRVLTDTGEVGWVPELVLKAFK